MAAAPDRVVMLGDTHADTARTVTAIESARRDSATVAISVGDFGLWNDPDGQAFLDAAEDACSVNGIPLLIAPGNHENHPWIAGLPVVNGLHQARPHLLVMPPGYRWTWHGQTWLALGGAHSVDRPHLTPNVDWFPEEAITAGQAMRAAAAGHADVMVTHDSPGRVALPEAVTVHDARWDPRELAAATDHRDLLQHVVDAVSPSLLTHGHYHHRYHADLPLPDGNQTRVIGLADNRHPLDQMMLTIDLPVPTPVQYR